MSEEITSIYINGTARRWAAVGAAALGLALMGFYAVSDAAHLEQHALLDGADWLGYGICHRLPGHSLTIAGRPFPLCARCTGMYLGVVLSLLLFWLMGRLRRTELPPLPILLTLLGFIGLMGVDGVNSMLHFLPHAPYLYTPQNWLRLLTGLGTGLAMGSILLPALAQVLWRQYMPMPMLASWGDLRDLLLLAGAVLLLALSNQSVVLYVLALVSTAGVLLALGTINAVLGLILLRQDGRAERWQETAVPLALSLLLAIIELSTIGLVRYQLTGTMTGFS